MDTRPISDEDEELIEVASDVLREHFEADRHTTASALRTASGRVYTGISLQAATGTASVHCEPLTLGNAVLDGETDLDTTVAVTYRNHDPANGIHVVSACGVCRELLFNFDADTMVVFPDEGVLRKAPVRDLLPAKSR